MHMDPALPRLVGVIVAILLTGLVSRRLRQPHVVTYLLVGVLIGPQLLGLLEDQATITRLGEAGVIVLLFFLGMEVSIHRLLSGWRVAVIGTLFQILGSVGLVWGLGAWLGWDLPRILLVGFAISLSSTAVVVALLRRSGDLDTEVGRDAVGILIVQDVALAPMLVVLGLMQGEAPSPGRLALQGTGAVLVAVFVVFVLRRERIRLPFVGAAVREDHELQVFMALLLCFGIALATALLQLSTALGAFLAGLLVSEARETEWVQRSMEPFRVVFVAVFFVSIGMLLEPGFLRREAPLLAVLVATVLVTNTLLNALVLRALGRRWRQSLRVGALLSQIGELSFVLAAVGWVSGVIGSGDYQLVVSTIALSLIVSPAWITAVERLLPRRG